MKPLSPGKWSFLCAPAVCVMAVLLVTLGAVGVAAAQGVLPDATTIPASTNPPVVDGACDEKEYGDAVVRNYADALGATRQVYLKHAGGNLYVCVTGVPGEVKDRFFRVYADPERGAEAFATANDLAFQVEVVSGALSAYRGTGVANGWTAAAVPGWEAKASYTPNGESAEFRIPLSLVNAACQKPSGLAVYHHWVSSVGDDYGWPSNKFYDQPKTWEEVMYGGASCVTELGINKNDSADPVPANQTFSYLLAVRNNGNTTATNAEVSDTLPATVVYDGYAAPAGTTCSFAAGTVTCTIGSLSSGATVTIELKLHGTVPGDISNTATVKATGTDPISANNSSTERTRITVPLTGRIAYVFRSDNVTAGQFKALLEGNGFTVVLIPLAEVLKRDFSEFDLVIIAHDTGYLNEWPSGTAGASPEATHISAANKPVVGLGEGGYAYLGKDGKPVGWPNGWHGPLDAVNPVNTGASYWHVPNDFGVPPSPLPLYLQPVAEVGIYLPSAPGTVAFGLEVADKEHAPLIAEKEDCDQLWGFAGPPEIMTGEAKKLFVNAVTYGLAQQCAPPPQIPPSECFKVIKSAEPSGGTGVKVGDSILYRIKYTVTNNPACAVARAVLEDTVPPDTLFVPGSASDGITPGADGVLRWNLGALAPGSSGEKLFKVSVVDSACRNQRTINNQARLSTSAGVITSNVVTHPVDCTPVVPEGTQPPYAEDEIEIYPYPLVAGRVTELSVRIRNLTGIAQTVTVAFETSPERFGIGLSYGPIPVAGNPRVVVLPPMGSVEVALNWTPATSGHYCIRVKIESRGHPPVYTYRNLDVTENLQPGVRDDLPFAVRNPTAAKADMVLVVDNTCPGWTAWVTPAVLAGMMPGEVRTATLSVVPPADRPLGTECHIDVQAWIGDQLIGGIRKLDVPPVQLPEANPPWEEREIVLLPNPPVLGVPGQICVDVQNPLGVPRTVNLEFSVAAFGAGIPFTPVGSRPGVVLPANSITRHCINWMPTAVSNGNLHRCIQVRISQAGFVDQVSQRNVDLRRLRLASWAELLALRIPFSIGNPEPFPQELRVEMRVVGLRRWPGIIDPDPPMIEGIQPAIDPQPPKVLPAGAAHDFTLRFVQPGLTAAMGDVGEPGDAASVEVTVYLNDRPAGGFSAVVEVGPRLYLPVIRK